MKEALRTDAVLIQAGIAGALSFAHLHDIAEAAGQDGWKAWAYPISVDLLLVAAWRQLRRLREVGAPTRGAWTWFTVALVASLGANVATAGLLDLAQVPAWLRILVAGWPALAFLGGTLLVHASPHPHAAPAPAAPTPADPAEHAADSEQSATSAPALPAPLPAGLVSHAQRIADAYRQQTGEPIGTDALRVRLGVPAPLAAQLATQLT